MIEPKEFVHALDVHGITFEVLDGFPSLLGGECIELGFKLIGELSEVIVVIEVVVSDIDIIEIDAACSLGLVCVNL